MKKCTVCKLDKPFSEFSPRADVSDGLYSRCRTCHNAEVRKGYHKDPKSKLEDCRRRRQVLFDIVNGIKAERGCIICRDYEPICLDFHHLDPTKKDLSVSKLVTLKSKERMLREIEKCVVICVKCHRKLHAGMISLTTDVMVA